MTENEQINDKFRQQVHAEAVQQKRDLLQAQRDFMKNPKRESPAMQRTFARALSQNVGMQPRPLVQTTLPDPKKSGVEGGIVKITACVDNGDDTFSTLKLNVQATKAGTV